MFYFKEHPEGTSESSLIPDGPSILNVQALTAGE